MQLKTTRINPWQVSLAAIATAFSVATPALAQIDEITVSATRRAGTTVQEVPIAVSAYDSKAIENAGIQDARDLVQLAPSFNFFTGQSNSAGTTAYIRGIGTGGDNPGFESAVGFFIDGVFRSRPGTALNDLPEIERVEILRGPQGTLFGRNTSAGVVNITTAGPDTQDVRLFGSASYGNYDAVELNAGVTGPVASGLALRLDGGLRQRDGYVDDINSDREFNDKDRWFVRGQALWDITDSASLRIIADGAETDEQCCVAVTVEASGPLPTAINTVAGLAGNTGITSDINPENRVGAFSPNRDYSEQTEEIGISGELNWDIPWGRLTAITAYRDWEATRNQDVDFSGLDRAYREGYKTSFETFTQEFRLQGITGRVDWLVGAFYLNETSELLDTVRFGTQAAEFVDALASPSTVFGSLGGVGVLPPTPEGQGQDDDFSTDTESLAIFTHNVISLATNWDLTLGLRWNHEEKELTGDLTGGTGDTCDAMNAAILAGLDADFVTLGGLGILACNPAVNTESNGLYNDSLEEDEWSGTASLSWKATEDLLVYAGYSRGYKSGGYNMDRSSFSHGLDTLAVGVQPSTLPVGIRPAPDVDQLQFDPEFVDAYEIGAKLTTFGSTTTINAALFYQEVEDFQLNAFTGFNFLTFNIPEAISQGAELEILSQPVDGLTLAGGITYTDAYYDSQVNEPGVTIASGTQFAYVPEVAITSSVTYSYPLPNLNDMVALFHIDGRWNSGYAISALSRRDSLENDAFAIFNARIGIGPSSERWALEGWVQNLTDEYYSVGGFGVPEQTSSGFGHYAVYPNPPRTYGATVRVNF